MYCECRSLIYHVLQVKMAEHSKTPEDFLRKYDELKSKNARNLDPLVYLLSKLTEDKEVGLMKLIIHFHTSSSHNPPLNSYICQCLQTLKFLQQNAKERSEMSANAASGTTTSYSIPTTSSKMSMQELEELRKKLGNVTASSNVPQVV